MYNRVPDMEQVVTLLGYNLPPALPVGTRNCQDQMAECLRVPREEKVAVAAKQR